MDLPDLSPDRSLVENKILKSFSDNFLQDEFEELHGQPPEKKMKYDFEAMEQVQKCNLLPKHPKIILKADLGLSLDKNNPLTVDSPSNVPQIIQRDEIAALKSDEVVSESQVIASEDNQINVMKDKIAAPKSDEVLITNDEIAASKQAQVVVLGSNEETICKKKIISDGKPIGQLKVQVLPSPKFGSITLKNASLLTTPGASPASTDMFWTGKINSIKSTSKFPNNIYSNILHKTLVKATNCSKAEKKEIIVEPEVIDIENNTNNNSTELPESKIKTKNEIVKPIKKNFNGTVKPKILNNLILDKKSIMSPNQQSPIQFVNIKTLQNGQRVVVVNKSKQSLLKEPVSHKSIDSGTLNSTTCESNKQSKVHPNLSKIEILSKVTEPSATKIELIKLNKNLEKLKNNGISTAILANNSNISYNPFHKFNKTNSLANDKLQPKYEDETWCDDQEDFRYKLNDLEKLPLQQNTRNNRQLVNKNRNINNIEITKRAIKTVKNDKVFKAVKALESCGVEVSEIVAVPSEEIQKNKIINNSATQTEVFSLLENGEFIEATTLKKDVTRLKLVNDVTVQSENINLVGLDLKENFKNKLDNMLKKNFPNCKQITFAYTTSDIVSKINQQLQRDYYNAKNFDNNGLLGIHRAVRANDLRQVQRHLLIVRMLRQDIDINTECGKVFTM